MYLNANKFISQTEVEGPGKRACIYLQGCSIRCKGCIYPQSWPKGNNLIFYIDDIADRILNGPEIEGVTFSGGEPFDQAEPLAVLGSILKEEDLSVVTFTGNIYEDIILSQNINWYILLSITDILIDGPYLKEKADISRLWVGSSNQRYHFLTDRYKNFNFKMPNKIEIRIQDDGEVIVNGIISANELKKLFEGI